jgi:protein Shroom
MEQLDEAKRLKESIDRRSAMVSQFLQNYLSESDYADYEHFVKMKAKLIMDSREISDKIKLGEEQLQALKDSIVNSPVPKTHNSHSSISYNTTVGCDNNVFESKTTL